MTAEVIMRCHVDDDIAAKVASIKAEGMAYVHVSSPPGKPDRIWLEGWIEKPADLGPRPWEATS